MMVKISQIFYYKSTKKFLWLAINFFFLFLLFFPKLGSAQLNLSCSGTCIRGSDCFISLNFTCPAPIPAGTNCLVTGNMPPIGANAQCGSGGNVVYSGSDYPSSGSYETTVTCQGISDTCSTPILNTPPTSNNNGNGVCEPGESGPPDCDNNCDPTTECGSADCIGNTLCNSGGCDADGNCNSSCAGAGFTDPDCSTPPPTGGPTGKICAGVPPPTQNPKLCENIVPCGGCWEPPCNLCYLFQTISNIVNCLLRLAFLVGAVLIVIGGILILLSGFYPGLRQQGKNIFLAVIYGLIMAMLSYIIVFTIISLFASNLADFNFSATGFTFTCKGY